MLKFLAGLVLGMVLAVAYVRFDVELPAFLQIADRLQGNAVSSAIEADLYDLDADAGRRMRALEIYFANRAADAARADAEAGHPFLKALERARLRREAREVLAMDEAAGKALGQPGLRAALERKHGTRDEAMLRRAMTADAVASRPFLDGWLKREAGIPASEDATSRLRVLAGP
ncbi:MAG: hypothetical protein R3D33_08315 [Hyphomicrobiaceae bacterium]